VLTSEAI